MSLSTAIDVIETINQPSEWRRPNMGPSSLTGAYIMHLNSLFRSLFAAYACGASGTYEHHYD
jgi:hypothetical protein